jgi:hypothetical protein
MNKMICLLFITASLPSFAQTIAEKPKILYGVCTKDSLVAEPFGKWFTSGYDT